MYSDHPEITFLCTGCPKKGRLLVLSKQFGTLNLCAKIVHIFWTKPTIPLFSGHLLVKIDIYNNFLNINKGD